MVSKAVTLVVFALASCGNERAAAQSTTCPNGEKPLLWQLTKGSDSAYLVGSYNIPADDMKNQEGSNQYSDLDASIQQALKCADIAYFQFGCDLANKNMDAVGHYMAHCAYYPIVDEQDAIDDRLTEVQMFNLKDAITKFTALAPSACKTAVETFFESAKNVEDNVTYRTTLLDLYHQSIEAINPLWCDPKNSQVQSYETFLRQQFGTTKPIFGLEDIGSECQVYQGNSVEQDAQLANVMSTNFKNPIWVNNVTTMLGDMKQVMQCGDLTQLAQMMDFFKDLPLASERMMSERNANLKYGIEEAIKSNPGRILLFVLPVTHIIDAAGRQGVLSLLAQDGIQSARAGESTSLSCQVSSFEAPGAMALGHCLKPPSQNQPTSCTAFEIEFDRLLGSDVMYQRTKTQTPECATCVNSTEQCQCEMKWENTGVFKNLCEATEVDGTFGKVFWLDMTRNPGSTRTGRRLAQKTVIGLYQNCYATSCDMSQLQSMATRNWYKDDPDLAVASVSIRRLGDPYGVNVVASGGGGPPWFWYLLAVVLIGLCVFGLIKVFLMPKKSSKNGRGRYSSDFSEADENLKGDDRDYEQMQPLSMGDSPDPGEPMPPQGGNVPPMQVAAAGSSRGMQMQPQMPGASPSMQAYQGSMQGYSTNGAGYTAGAYTGQSFTPVGSQAGGRPQELQQPGNNLMAQAMQMSQQIEMTGSQAVRSLTASQYVPTYPQTSAPIQPTSYTVSYSQPQMGTPTYQPSQGQVYLPQ